jgi:transposase InsO family protein
VTVIDQQALAMVRNGQSPRSVAEALGISENLIHSWKRTSRALPKAAEDEIEQLRLRLEQVEMERDILYIEGYYDRIRRHSALGYLSPEDFERAYYQRADGRKSLDDCATTSIGAARNL